ncbi:MAG: hypothetical protein EBV03_08910 [Proteobacteria bacterium]|nr:hypothetical protein [Pseudomonadota bacterium]
MMWGITDGSAGMQAQIKALAAAMGQPVEMKKIDIKKPFAWLPNSVHAALWPHSIVPGKLTAGSDALIAPWPKLVVSCGRRGALAAMSLRKHTPPHQPLYVNIQDPQMDPRLFDVVIAMAHDRLKGENVIVAEYALHAVTPEALAQAKVKFTPRFASYAAPRVAVLLGGSTNKYTLTEKGMAQVIAQLKAVLAMQPCSLLITPSRRTGEKNIAALRAAFAGEARVYIYDFVEENPYMGLLALADHIIVTDDSVNMMTEAQATGAPVHLLGLPGHKNTKPARFGQMLEKKGSARALAAKLERWSYTPSDEMQKLVKKLELKLANAVW